MILKLNTFQKDTLDKTDVLLLNMDQVASIHNTHVTREGAAIIGETNEIDAAAVSLASGRTFLIKERAEQIYSLLPYALTRQPIEPVSGSKVI